MTGPLIFLAALMAAASFGRRSGRRALAGDLSGIEAKAALLEREGRGITAFTEKWHAAMAKWDGKVALAAAEPPPARDEPDSSAPEVSDHDDDAAAQLAERFKIETIADLMNLPPATWLVPGWFPARSAGVVYGAWGTGKSFWVLDLALHLAHGLPDWHGAALPEGGGDVLYIAREGHAGFLQRVNAWEKHHGIAEHTSRLHFMRSGVRFDREADVDGLYRRIQAAGINYKLTIIDTVARVLPGAEINKAGTITLFTERCAALSETTDATVIGVHHEKTGTMMGSVYFEANADFVYKMTRIGDDGPLERGEIVCAKQKGGPDGWKKSLTFKLIPLTPLGDKSSLVLEAISEGSTHAPDGLPSRDVCKRILAAIGTAADAKKPLSHMAQSKANGRYAPDVLAHRFSADKVKPKQVLALINMWLENDLLSFEVVSSKTKQCGLRVIGSLDEVVQG